MNYPATGYHHITACAGGAQEDVELLYRRRRPAAGQTDRADGRQGAALPLVLLQCEHRARLDHDHVSLQPPARDDADRARCSRLRTRFARDRCRSGRSISRSTRSNTRRVEERFGQKFIRFSHPAGLCFEVWRTRTTRASGWTTKEIAASEVSVRGFHGTVLSVRDVSEQEKFLIEALGFRKTGVDRAYHRFEIGSGGANKTLTLLHEPDRAPGSWTFGAGTVHHVALWVADDEALAAQKAIYEELGYTDASEIKDRFYFHSMYVRSPGGILVECCCNVPGGFEKDEKAASWAPRFTCHRGSRIAARRFWPTSSRSCAPADATSRN